MRGKISGEHATAIIHGRSLWAGLPAAGSHTGENWLILDEWGGGIATSDGTKWKYDRAAMIYSGSPSDLVQSTTAFSLLRNVLIPGGLLGDLGKIIVDPIFEYTSSANAKSPRILASQDGVIATATSMWTHPQSSSSTSVFPYLMHGDASVSQLIGGTSGATNASVGQSTAAAPPTAEVDTMLDWYIGIACTMANGSEFVRLRHLTVTVQPRWSA